MLSSKGSSDIVFAGEKIPHKKRAAKEDEMTLLPLKVDVSPQIRGS